ncbi:hypothetical protein POM88_032996 [Heracleum sosnowskyi]|uniref:Uncharacterized protein n=1 Tax=Heracleum sosnowskyi TaxID=360622 RepID=A0AAD8MLV0_9APIA|nr:hypothetical protein POM88_032996 [Heracleum sosnowskyi]
MDFGVGVGNWGAMSLSKILFDCEQEKELKVGLKYEEKVFSSWDNYIIQVNFERTSRILKDYFQQLMAGSHDLDATKKIKEILIGDSKLADGLNPLVFNRLVDILDENNNEATKGSAACILAFANIDKCDVDNKKRATEVLLRLMSDERDTMSIPVLRTLTRWAYFSNDYASFVIENGALQGALAVLEPIYPNLKIIQTLVKFLLVVVRQGKVPDDKVRTVLTILDTILEVGQCNLRCLVRACYTISSIKVELWVNKGNILNNIIDLIWHWDDTVAYTALRLVAKVVQLEKPPEILTKKYKFLQCLELSEICCKPKKFQMEVCSIFLDMATNGGPSTKDLHKSGMMDTLFELLEVDDFDVRTEAASVVHMYELARETDQNEPATYEEAKGKPEWEAEYEDEQNGVIGLDQAVINSYPKFPFVIGSGGIRHSFVYAAVRGGAAFSVHQWQDRRR